MSFFSRVRAPFLPNVGALAFFTSIIVWGIGTGCFAAVLNNYLVDIHQLNPYERGWLEFFREMPGLLLVFILALLHRVSDWNILRLGIMISMLGVGAMFIPGNKFTATLLIMVWSMGEHLTMPVRSSIAMQIARDGRLGQSLGMVTSVQNAGTVLGSLIVAAVFHVGLKYYEIHHKLPLYNLVWGIILVLVTISLCCTFSKNAPRTTSRRPRLYFRRKFSIFYALELFYGARKQIFMTFAPFVLVVKYGLSTSQIALLLGFCAAVNIFGSPLIGRLTDRIGYRNTMIWDTVVLFFVCLLYGYAGRWFSPAVAVHVVCINFLLDAVISTTSLATKLYVRDIADTPDEVTSSLTTGISINHLISIASAPVGGWVWHRFGVEVLFGFAAVMAIANTLCALLIRKPKPSAGLAPSS